MSKRVLVILAILVVGAPAAILAGSNRAPLPKRFRVYDANGGPVGLLVDATQDGSNAVALVDLEEHPPFPVVVLRHFLSGSAQHIWFQSNNCTGTPLFATYSGTIRVSALPFVFVSEQTGQIFISDIEADPFNSSVGSVWDRETGCFANTNNSGSPFVPGFSVPTVFTPPFQVFAEY